jgi:hypothetical protein
MKKKPKVKPVQMYGIGPVQYRHEGGAEAPISLGIDFWQARTPDAHTYADCVSLKIDKELGMSTILFGQTGLNSTGESLGMLMSNVSLFGQFIPSVKNVEETLDLQLKALNLQAARRPVPSEAVLRTTRFASVIYLVTSATEAAMDFYYLPGRDIHFAKLHHTEIGLEPLVRVITPLPVLKYLLDLCRPYAQSSAGASQDSRSANRVSAL